MDDSSNFLYVNTDDEATVGNTYVYKVNKNQEVVTEPESIEPITDKAQERKGIPLYMGVMRYFPNALREVAKTSKQGNDQHHPDKPLHWDMSKSKDEYDALLRHLLDHDINPVDDDGVLHLAKVAWRALAGLERYLTNKH
tara:strand:- start:14933 stop:15352 length:420 start_codon:yes stop_codon:yes gene_type:complete